MATKSKSRPSYKKPGKEEGWNQQAYTSSLHEIQCYANTCLRIRSVCQYFKLWFPYGNKISSRPYEKHFRRFLCRCCSTVFTPIRSGNLHNALVEWAPPSNFTDKHQDVRQLSHTVGKWQVGSEPQWSASLESHCRRELEKVSQFCPIQYLLSRNHETS